MNSYEPSKWRTPMTTAMHVRTHVCLFVCVCVSMYAAVRIQPNENAEWHGALFSLVFFRLRGIEYKKIHTNPYKCIESEMFSALLFYSLSRLFTLSHFFISLLFTALFIVCVDTKHTHTHTKQIVFYMLHWNEINASVRCFGFDALFFLHSSECIYV